MIVEKFGWKESGIDEFISQDSYPNLPIFPNICLFINLIIFQI